MFLNVNQGCCESDTVDRTKLQRTRMAVVSPEVQSTGTCITREMDTFDMTPTYSQLYMFIVAIITKNANGKSTESSSELLEPQTTESNERAVGVI
jgi:hypothetical protein